LKFNELIEIIEASPDVAVNCKHFYVSSTYNWLDRNKNTDKNTPSASKIKETAQEIVEALTDKTNIYPAGYRFKNYASIYPVLN